MEGDNSNKKHLDSFQCPKCKKVYSERTKAAFDMHIARCGHNMYKCEDCGQKYSSIGSLKNHFKVHLQMKKYVCEVCYKTFSKSYSLKLHSAVHKSKDERQDQRLKCETCGKTFAWKASLRRHMQVHFKPGKAVYSCVCGKEFKNYSAFYSHKVSSKKCKSQIQKFKMTRSDLKRSNVHSAHASNKPKNERAAKVKNESSFESQQDSDVPQEKQMKSRQLHKCQFCEATFTRRCDLDDHIDVCDLDACVFTYSVPKEYSQVKDGDSHSDENSFLSEQKENIHSSDVDNEEIIDGKITSKKVPTKKIKTKLLNRLRNKVVQRTDVDENPENLEDKPVDSDAGIGRSRRKRKRKQFTDFEVDFVLKLSDDNESVEADNEKPKARTGEGHVENKITSGHKCDQCNMDFKSKRSLKSHVTRIHNKDSPSTGDIKCSEEIEDVQNVSEANASNETAMIDDLIQHDEKVPQSDLIEDEFNGDIASAAELDDESDKDYQSGEEIEDNNAKQTVYGKRVWSRKKKRSAAKVFSGSAFTGIKGERISDIKYKCTTSDCSKVFIQKKLFIKHKLEAHQERLDAICSECGNLFASVIILKSHLRMYHSNLKRVLLQYKNTEILHASDSSKPVFISVCPTCGFMYKDDDGDHECSPMELRYFCPFCETYKTRFADIQEHIQSLHPNGVVNETLKEAYQCMRSTEKEPALKINDGETTCKDCGEEFQATEELRDHANLKHATFPYCCGVCRSVYGRPNSLVKHMLAHCQSLFKCSFCPKEFYMKSDFERHTNMHTGERKYQCDQCGNSYCDERAVTRHLQKKHHEVYLQRYHSDKSLSVDRKQSLACICYICGKNCESADSLNRHLRGHNDRRFSCPDCPEVFARKYYLEKHRLQHLPEDVHDALRKKKSSKKLISSVCDKTRFQIVEKSAGKNLKCSLCNLRVTTPKQLSRHIESAHTKDNGKPYICKVCGRGFIARSMFVSHIRIHTDDKPYKCRLCERSYRQLSHIREHLRQHGKQVFACAVCGKPFKTKGALLAHAGRHCKQYPYVCPRKSCSTKFRELQLVINHCTTCIESSATEAVAYQCNLCLKEFEDSPSVIEHLYTHEKDEVFSCETCDMRFKRARQLYQHKVAENHFLASEIQNKAGLTFQRTFNFGGGGVAEVDWPGGLDDLLKQYDYVSPHQNDNDRAFNAAHENQMDDESEEDTRLAAEQLTNMASGLEQNIEIKAEADGAEIGSYEEMDPNKAGDRNNDVSLLAADDIVNFVTEVDGNAMHTEYLIVEENPFQEIINIERNSSLTGEEIVLYVQNKVDTKVVKVAAVNSEVKSEPQYVMEALDNVNSDAIPVDLNDASNVLINHGLVSVTETRNEIAVKDAVATEAYQSNESEKALDDPDDNYTDVNTNAEDVNSNQATNASVHVNVEETEKTTLNSNQPDHISFHLDVRENEEVIVNSSQSGVIEKNPGDTTELQEVETSVVADGVLSREENSVEYVNDGVQDALLIEAAGENNPESQYQVDEKDASDNQVKDSVGLLEGESIVDDQNNDVVVYSMNESGEPIQVTDSQEILKWDSGKQPLLIDEKGNEIIVYAMTESGEHVQVTDSEEILKWVLQSGKYQVEETCVDDIDKLYPNNESEQPIIQEIHADDATITIDDKSGITDTKSTFVCVVKDADSVRKNKPKPLRSRRAVKSKSDFNMGRVHGKLTVDFEDSSDSKANDPNCVNYRVGMHYYEDKNPDEYPFQCNVCQKRFKTLKSLNFHKKTHLPNEKRRYRCDACGSGFHTPLSLKIHSRIHTGDKPFKCSFCGKAFRQLGHLQTHIRLHEGYFPFECDMCEKKFVSNAQMNAHRKAKHSDNPEDKVGGGICEFCNKWFRFLDRHMLQHVDKESKKELLKYCNNVKDALTEEGKDDKKVGTDDQTETEIEWKHICDICGAGFKTKYNFKLHRMRHDSSTDFVCEVCNKGFASELLLKEHKGSHKQSSIETPCEICGLMIKSKSGLREHVKRHSESSELRYQCAKCKSVFPYKNGFVRHVTSCMKDEVTKRLSASATPLHIAKQ